MSQLLLPEGMARAPDGPPFDRDFFIEHFHSEEPPACELYVGGEIPVVELELINGEGCDVYLFEAFRPQFLIALLFVDPPNCDEFYRSFIRYETIFRVNIRYYAPPARRLGFQPTLPVIDASGLAEGDSGA